MEEKLVEIEAAMNEALWIVQISLFVLFLIAGLMKVLRSKEQLAAKMAWVEDFSAGQVRAIGSAEILGAAGLTLPALLGTMSWMTWLAALGLTLLMLGATWTHVRRKERTPMFFTLALALLAGFLAYGTFGAA